MKFPNGMEFEFQELKNVREEAKAVWLISEVGRKNTKNYDFIEIAELNPSLALAWLRIELEKSLKKLNEISWIEQKWNWIYHLMNNLYKNWIISSEEMSVLSDMIGTLNRAVHGEDYDPRISQWIISTGPQILDSINKKIDNLPDKNLK